MSKPFSSSKLKWCFSTLGCPELDLNAALDLAESFGISCIEIRCLGGSIDIHDILKEYPKTNTNRFQDIKRNQTIVALNTSFKLTNNTEADREEFIRLAQIADIYHAQYLRVFGGFPFDMKLDDNKLDTAAQTLNWFDQVRKRKKISCRIILETHDGYSSADRCAELMNFAGYELNILWDAHHTYCCAGESFTHSWNILRHQIKHVHVKDSIMANGNITHSLPGQGSLPVKELIELLNKDNFKGPVSLEWEKFWNKSIPELATALQAVIAADWIT